MPIELNDLLGNECWVDVRVAGGTFRVAYRPGATSLKRQAELQKKMRLLQNESNIDEEQQADMVGRIFCEVVSNWDLTSKGHPLPITPEVVTTQLPGAMFEAIMQAIGEDGRRGQEEKKALSATSAAGLPAAGRPANVPTGIPSSAPRDTWA